MIAQISEYRIAIRAVEFSREPHNEDEPAHHRLFIDCGENNVRFVEQFADVFVRDALA